MISMSLRGTGAAAVLCLLATAPRAAHAQTCEDGTILVGGACRPCGATGQFPCPADQSTPGCADGFTVNAEGRCRPCGDFQELVCVGANPEGHPGVISVGTALSWGISGIGIPVTTLGLQPMGHGTRLHRRPPSTQ